MACNAGPDIIEDGLVFCLDAANKRSYLGSGTAWDDLAGDFSGVMTNGLSFDSGNGGKILFDGSDEKVIGSCSPVKWHNWDKMSFTVIFNHTGITGQTGNRQYIVDFRHNGGINGALALFVDDPSGTPDLTLFYNTTGTGYEEPTVYNYTLGEWITYTFTFDKTTSTNNIRHYINGENVYNRSITANSTTTDSGDNITIGDYSSSYTGFLFNGYISFMAANTGIIFTPDQVRQNYEATKGRYA
tara:strand:- start:1171 stop:1899 length:729 start_codon:yes stop_codon:yes gene_type:complete